MKKTRIYLIDIDGTVCDDIPNEESHKFILAEPFIESRDRINEWFMDGNYICFFTARTEDHRDVTDRWLKQHSFKYHQLLMDKPRSMNGEEYVWIDNHPVRGVTYKGTWSNLVETQKTVSVFKGD
jgi:hypothetical protein